jgi:hypothetical protein
MTELQPQARFEPVAGLEINEVPDGYVIYERVGERVHFLNSTAALLFELCDGAHSVADIQAIVATAFELGSDHPALASDGIADLRREGLVRECAP